MTYNRKLYQKQYQHDKRRPFFGRTRKEVFITIRKAAPTRTCTKCKEKKSALFEFFDWRPDRKNFLSKCVVCAAEDSSKRHFSNPEMYNARQRQRAANHTPEQKATRTKQKKAWITANPDKMKGQNKRSSIKRSANTQYRLSRSIRSNMNQSIRKGSKDGRSWQNLVGYDLDELMVHLEAQFTDGMSWDTYGKYGWWIDHIKPITAFTYTTPDDPDFKECWALDNLQPLWYAENISKGGNWNDPCVI